jgi:hypothetical protein
MKKNLLLSALALAGLFCFNSSMAQSGLANLDFENPGAFTNHGCNSSTVQPSGFTGSMCGYNGVNGILSPSTTPQNGNYYMSIKNLQTCGYLDVGQYQSTKINPQSPGWGVPYTQRPTAFCGYFRSSGMVNTDTMYIVVYFSKNSAIIGSGKFLITANQPNWTNFCAPINFMNAQIPDTIKIRFAASRFFGTGNTTNMNSQTDVLEVDNCSLSFATGANEFSMHSALSISPNPANDKVNIVLQENTQVFTASLFDITGKQVLKKTISSHAGTLDVSDLAAGAYILKILSEGEVKTSRLIISR